MPEDDAAAPDADDTTSRSPRRSAASKAALEDSGDDTVADDSETDGPDDSADADPEDDAKPARRRKAPVWVETGVLLVVALAMALIIKTFFVQAFYIPSSSMEPGLQINDRILVQKVSYWFGGSPNHGDVVVFEDPGGWLTGPEEGPQTWLAKGLAKVGLYPTGGHLVKRVIGLPGDTVQCCNAKGQLSVNGYALDEDDFIAPQKQCDAPMVNCDRKWKIIIPDDRLFVMGDNRSFSADSSERYRQLCGGVGKPVCEKALVPLDLVVGKVFALVWPIKHADFIGDPDVFDKVPAAK